MNSYRTLIRSIAFACLIYSASAFAAISCTEVFHPIVLTDGVYHVPGDIASHYGNLGYKHNSEFKTKAGIYIIKETGEIVLPHPFILNQRLGLGPGKSELWFIPQNERVIPKESYWRDLSEGKVGVGITSMISLSHDILNHGPVMAVLAKESIMAEAKSHMQKAFQIYDHPATSTRDRELALNLVGTHAAIIENSLTPSEAIRRLKERYGFTEGLHSSGVDYPNFLIYVNPKNWGDMLEFLRKYEFYKWNSGE